MIWKFRVEFTSRLISCCIVFMLIVNARSFWVCYVKKITNGPFESCVENQGNDRFAITLKFFRKPFSIQFDGLYPIASGYYLELRNLKSLVSMSLYLDSKMFIDT